MSVTPAVGGITSGHGVVDAATHVRRLAKASGVLNRSDIRSLHQAAAVGQDVCRMSVSSLVAAAQGGPMLRVVQSDGTPVNVKKTIGIEQQHANSIALRAVPARVRKGANASRVVFSPAIVVFRL